MSPAKDPVSQSKAEAKRTPNIDLWLLRMPGHMGRHATERQASANLCTGVRAHTTHLKDSQKASLSHLKLSGFERNPYCTISKSYMSTRSLHIKPKA